MMTKRESVAAGAALGRRLNTFGRWAGRLSRLTNKNVKISAGPNIIVQCLIAP